MSRSLPRLLVASLLTLLALGVPRPASHIEVETPSWKVLALLFDSADVTVPGLSGPRHLTPAMNPSDRRLLEKELAAFSRRVRKKTRGKLKVSVDVRRLDGPIRSLSGPGPFWLGSADVRPFLTGIDTQAYDMVFAFVKVGENTGPAIPVTFVGATVGGDRGLDGACFAGITFRPSWIDGSGTVVLHEFLHGLRWALTEVDGFPDTSIPSPDEGARGSIRPPSAPAGYGPFADYVLSHFITVAMCRAADPRHGPARRDGYVRGFSVDGATHRTVARTVRMPPGSKTATARLPEGVKSLRIVTDDCIAVTIGGQKKVFVNRDERLPGGTGLIQVKRVHSGTRIRFRVRAETGPTSASSSAEGIARAMPSVR